MSTNYDKEIRFQEGDVWDVMIPIPEPIRMDLYKASIQVRKFPSRELMLEFKSENDTLHIVDQQIFFHIPAQKTLGKSGKFKWQLKIYSSASNAFRSPFYDFIIDPSVNI